MAGVCREILALGAIKGGWDNALGNKLDLTDADNKKVKQVGLMLSYPKS